MKSIFKPIFYFGLLVISNLFTPTTQWGPIGHQAVAKISQDLINYSTQQAINKLIPDGNMTAVANWADEVRSLPAFKWSEPLHFINAPSWVCNYNRERDCYNEEGQYLMCVDGAIQNYTNRLLSNPQSDDLKFLIHFVGDIAQPLHCGFSEDRGGNTIHVDLLKKSTNLHAVWDSGIIENVINVNFGGNWLNWIQYLEYNFQPLGNITCDFKNGVCGQIWGDESTNLACEYAYINMDGNKIVNGTHLTETYIQSRIKIINKQIVKAALRLTFLLNEIFK